jgi:pyrroline-5-carboxylate reductase
MKLSFIGGGKMAESIVHGVLAGKLAAPGDIAIGEPVADRRAFLSSEFGVAPVADNLEAVSGSDLIVLAIKPQDLGSVLSQLKGCLKPGQAALSIVAGARMDTLSQGLNHGAVVRVMPNTPAQVGSGMTLWTCSPGVAEEQREMTKAVLSSVGEEIYVSDEKYMDMATALSASGPALCLPVHRGAH